MQKTILEIITKENITFFVVNIIPILTLVGAVLAALAAVYKYFNEKNREFYMTILSNVYAPLFEEIVKMEYARKHLKRLYKTKEGKVEIDGKVLGKAKYRVKYNPFIYFNNTKTKTTWKIGQPPETKVEKTELFNFDKTLGDLLRNVDFNYASMDLVSLLKIYFWMPEIFKEVEGFEYEKELKKLQKKIRHNIIVGYKKYRRKLGLKDVSIDRFCIVIGGIIIFR